MSGSKIPFRKQMEFDYAEVQQITPMIRRVVARNPSNFTFHGTNTYIIGHGNVAVIDPGPMIEEHLEALKSALKDDTVEHILVTHTHNDHSPGAVPLREKIGGQIASGSSEEPPVAAPKGHVVAKKSQNQSDSEAEEEAVLWLS